MLRPCNNYTQFSDSLSRVFEAAAIVSEDIWESRIATKVCAKRSPLHACRISDRYTRDTRRQLLRGIHMARTKAPKYAVDRLCPAVDSKWIFLRIKILNQAHDDAKISLGTYHSGNILVLPRRYALCLIECFQAAFGPFWVVWTIWTAHHIRSDQFLVDDHIAGPRIDLPLAQHDTSTVPVNLVYGQKALHTSETQASAL